MERILFSPLGDTDPVRGCYDGAMLHILRHYQPERVVLFYTQDMAEKEHRDHRYTRAIHRTASDCVIEEIFTDIQEAHLYESFSQILPQEVLRLRSENQGAQILLNLSSGTPQMKTVLAMLAADMENCVGIQVAAPSRTSNRANEATQDAEDIDALLENNFDEEEGAENRCDEPPLGIFRYYAERSRIQSLIESYEYAAALKIARASSLVPKGAVMLLSYAAKRSILLTDTAKDILREYHGRKLFPFQGRAESFVEYFLIMQLDQETGRLSNLLLRVMVFLDDFLRYYVERYVNLSIRDLCDKNCLSRKKISTFEPDLLADLDAAFDGDYRDAKLSFSNLVPYCVYAGRKQRVRDAALHTGLMEELEKIKDARKLRNHVAHEMMNVTEEMFRERIGVGSHELVSVLARLLTLVYGEAVRNIRDIYRDLNGWIETSMEIHA